MSEVEITLNGKTETLVVSLRAARIVNAGGGFGEAHRKLAVFDLNGYVTVIAAGLNKKPSDIEEAVFKNGLVDLNEPLGQYINMLANGGRSLVAQETDAPGEA